MYDVIVIGSATQDIILSTDAADVISNGKFATGKGLCLPFGSKVPVRKLVSSSGGGGTNAAVTFARQGLKTACIGIVGSDTNGTALLDELRRENVDAKWFQIHHDDMTAYSVILVGSEGERTILSYKGEGVHWNVGDLPWDQMGSKWMYVNSLGGHIDMLERIVELAKGKGIHLATNPGPKELEAGLARLAPLWKSFDIVGMNQEEAAKLTGMPYTKEGDIFKKLDEAIGGIFIMTRGSDGAVVSDGHFIYTSGIPSSEVVERTGAGDAFQSGFVVEFMRSGSIEKAIQFGTANASSVVLHYGAKEGLLRKGDDGPWPPVEVQKRKL